MVRVSGRDKIYERVEPDGAIRRTAVSKGTGEIGKGLFRRILKQQPGIDKQTFGDNKRLVRGRGMILAGFQD